MFFVKQLKMHLLSENFNCMKNLYVTHKTFNKWTDSTCNLHFVDL